MVALKSNYDNPLALVGGTWVWGLTTAILMARVTSGSWLDTTAFTARPVRTLSWFMLGVSAAVYS